MCIAATFLFGAQIDKPTKRWIEGIERRVNVTSVAIDHIRDLKLLGLERCVADLMQRLRVEEVRIARTAKRLYIIREEFCKC